MDRLTLNALRAFAWCWSAAACAPPPVSSRSPLGGERHLRELERWLGVTLLRRATPAACAHRAGPAVGEARRSALHAMQQAVEAVREQRSSYSVSVSTTPSFAVRWLLRACRRYSVSYPRLEFQSSSISVWMNRSFSSDLAIRHRQGPWPALLAEPLMDESVYPLMSAALWRQSGRPRILRSCVGCACCTIRSEHQLAVVGQKYGPAALMCARPAFASSDLLLRAAAQAGSRACPSPPGA